MKNLLKTALSLLALTGTLYVGGCTSQPEEETPITPPVVVYDGVTGLRAQEHILVLFQGESTGLNIDYFPRILKPTLKYTSSDESVATVDENGVVTAVGAGKGEITVSNSDGSVTKTIPVTVSDGKLSSTKRSGLINTINRKIKADHLDEFDMVRIYENSEEQRYLNGVKIKDENSDQEMIISKSNAFFAIYGTDKTSKCADGSTTIENWGWIIYTNEYYDTYCFHISGYTKNYCVVSTTSFVEKEGGRYAAMCGVLDNLFLSGHAIVDNYIKYSIGTDVLAAGNESGVIKGGSIGDGHFMFSYGETSNDEIAPKEEDDYDLPAGTKGVTTFKLKMNYDEYLANYREMYMETDYDLSPDTIKDISFRRMAFDHKITELEYPNKDDYAKVDTFMDL